MACYAAVLLLYLTEEVCEPGGHVIRGVWKRNNLSLPNHRLDRMYLNNRLLTAIGLRANVSVTVRVENTGKVASSVPVLLWLRRNSSSASSGGNEGSEEGGAGGAERLELEFMPCGDAATRNDAAAAAAVVKCDRVVANVGFRPDASLYQELQVHQCYASEGPMKLAAALLYHSTAVRLLFFDDSIRIFVFSVFLNIADRGGGLCGRKPLRHARGLVVPKRLARARVEVLGPVPHRLLGDGAAPGW